MVEALLFLGELVLMGAFLAQVSKSEKTKAKKLDGVFSSHDSVAKKVPASLKRFPGA